MRFVRQLLNSIYTEVADGLSLNLRMCRLWTGEELRKIKVTVGSGVTGRVNPLMHKVAKMET